MDCFHPSLFSDVTSTDIPQHETTDDPCVFDAKAMLGLDTDFDIGCDVFGDAYCPFELDFDTGLLSSGAEDSNDGMITHDDIGVNDGDGRPVASAQLSNHEEERLSRIRRPKATWTMPPNNRRVMYNLFRCPYDTCEEVFTRVRELRCHVKLHVGDGYPCKWMGCGMVFVDTISLHSHIYETHMDALSLCGGGGKSGETCPECLLKFPDSDSVKRHCDMYHQGFSEGGVCRIARCGVSVGGKSKHTEHYKTAHRLFYHECSRCGAELPNAVEFKKHVRAHHSSSKGNALKRNTSIYSSDR